MIETVTMVRYVNKEVLQRYEDTQSPSKNLTDQLVVPPIGATKKIKHGTNRQSPHPVDHGIGIPKKVKRVTNRQSVHLDEIRLEKKSSTEFGYDQPLAKRAVTEFSYLQPVDKVIVNVDRQKTVHFDDFVRIRYLALIQIRIEVSCMC